MFNCGQMKKKPGQPFLFILILLILKFHYRECTLRQHSYVDRDIIFVGNETNHYIRENLREALTIFEKKKYSENLCDQHFFLKW